MVTAVNEATEIKRVIDFLQSRKKSAFDRSDGVTYERLGNHIKALEDMLAAAPQPPQQADKAQELEWQPIETAPKDNKRPLFIARFNDDGTMQSFDYDASWEKESESWEMPQVYYYWASANGNVEEPTHWCYEPEGFSKLTDQAIEALNKKPVEG